MRLLLIFMLYALALSAALSRRGFRSAAVRPVGESRKNLSRILIVGATGGTGRQLVSQALERGLTVTAFVRNPARLQIEHPRLRLIEGDVLDYSSVEAAVRGQDAVLCALGHKRFFYPTRILSGGTRNLLRAMQAQGVPRFICETSLGIGDSAGCMGLYYTFFVVPVVLSCYFWDKARQERLIAASGLEWVIVRPGVLTNGKKRGEYQHGPGVGSLLRTVRISRADVADFMLNQLAGNTYIGAAPGISW